MSDEYQLRKDIDGIYQKFYDYQRQQWNVITLDDLPTIDSALSISSSNPVQNSVITNAINDLSDQSFGGTMYDIRVYDYTNNTKGNEIYNANIDQKVLVEIIPYSFSGIAKQLPSQNIDVDIIDKSGASTVTATGYDDLATGVMSWRYVYTCSQWGQCRFSIKTYSSFISVDAMSKTDITSALNNKSNTNHTHTWTSQSCTSYGTLYINSAIRMCELIYYRQGYNFTGTSMVTLHSNAIPTDYRPKGIKYNIGSSLNTMIEVGTNGTISARTNNAGTYNLNFTLMWHY